MREAGWVNVGLPGWGFYQWTGGGKPLAPSDKKESRGLEGRLIYPDGKGSEQQA